MSRNQSLLAVTQGAADALITRSILLKRFAMVVQRVGNVSAEPQIPQITI